MTAFAKLVGDAKDRRTKFTKLEWFAGLSLQGLLANSNQEVVNWKSPTLAKIAVEQAEELIRILNKVQQ